MPTSCRLPVCASRRRRRLPGAPTSAATHEEEDDGQNDDDHDHGPEQSHARGCPPDGGSKPTTIADDYSNLPAKDDAWWTEYRNRLEQIAQEAADPS
jgi:hypothetical protein